MFVSKCFGKKKKPVSFDIRTKIYLLNSITLAGLPRYLVSKLTIKIFLNINKLDLMHFRNILDQMTLCGCGFC